MKKGRHNRASLLGPVKRDVPETFFRLCHHCLFLNESPREVEHCIRCDKEFTLKELPAFYGFLPVDEELDRQMEEPSEEFSEDELIEGKPPRKKAPLAGLNVKW